MKTIGIRAGESGAKATAIQTLVRASDVLPSRSV